MFYPSSSYEIDNFLNSNSACPITSLVIAEAEKGAIASNFLSSEGTSISITTTITGKKISLSMPDSKTVLETYYFRILAS
jgi:hypothetical protein